MSKENRYRLGSVGTRIAIAVALVLSALVAPLALAGHDPSHVETVVISASNPNGNTSATALTSGETYRFTVTGSYKYGINTGAGAHSRADAECSNLPPDTSYQRQRYILLTQDPNKDLLDLYVNGNNVEWQPTTPDNFECDGAGHSYWIEHKPLSTGPVNFRVFDNGFPDNNGAFTVEISRGVAVTSFVLNSRSKPGVSVSLSGSSNYLIEARGTYFYGKLNGQVDSGALADAECATVADGTGAAAPYRRDPYGNQQTGGTQLTGTGDSLDIYIGGANQEWQAENPTPEGCDETTHTYSVLYNPPTTGPVKFTLNDGYFLDNAGSLEVTIFQAAPGRTPSEPPLTNPLDDVMVDPSNPNGTTSPVPVRQGESLLVEARGTYKYGAGEADVECSNWTINRVPPDPVFIREREFPGITQPHFLDLLINQEAVDWTAIQPDTLGCDPAHSYRLIYIPATAGTLNFRVKDTYFGDNAGVLNVKVFRIREIPLGGLTVDSTRAKGDFGADGAPSRPVIQVAGLRYRYQAAGIYQYGVGQADSECSSSTTDPTFVPFRYATLDTARDMLDLLVNNASVVWVPHKPDPVQPACDLEHIYDYEFTATATRQANLRLHDGRRTDNSGLVTIDIFLKAS